MMSTILEDTYFFTRFLRCFQCLLSFYFNTESAPFEALWWDICWASSMETNESPTVAGALDPKICIDFFLQHCSNQVIAGWLDWWFHNFTEAVSHFFWMDTFRSKLDSVSCGAAFLECCTGLSECRSLENCHASVDLRGVGLCECFVAALYPIHRFRWIEFFRTERLRLNKCICIDDASLCRPRMASGRVIAAYCSHQLELKKIWSY